MMEDVTRFCILSVATLVGERCYPAHCWYAPYVRRSLCPSASESSRCRAVERAVASQSKRHGRLPLALVGCFDHFLGREKGPPFSPGLEKCKVQRGYIVLCTYMCCLLPYLLSCGLSCGLGAKKKKDTIRPRGGAMAAVVTTRELGGRVGPQQHLDECDRCGHERAAGGARGPRRRADGRGRCW